MKKYIVLLSVVLSSCSTMKIEEQIVQDFIKEKDLKNSSCADCSYLIEEAGSSENVLNSYELAYQDKNLSEDKRRMDVSPYNYDWSIDMKEVETLKSIIRKNNETYYWNSKNFKNLDIPIIGKKEFLQKTNTRVIPSTSIGYSVSKPVLSINKKYAFIQYSGIMDVGGIKERYYVMEKVGDKWIIKLKLFDANTFE